MCILNSLLGAPLPGTDACHRHIVVDGGVHMLLREDIHAEHVAIVSCPGKVPDDDWLRALDAPWMAAAGAPDPCARSAICVEPGSGRTLLVSVWQRASLTLQTFRSAVDAQLETHRAWEAHLESAPPATLVEGDAS